METLTQSRPSRMQRAVLTSANVAPDLVKSCDFRTVGGVDKARLNPLVTATEAVPGLLTQVLNSRLRMTCEATLRSSEQVSSRSFVEKAASSYVVSLKLGSQGDVALLQIDYMLLFPLIDRLLGGSGGPSELARDVTEIENHIAGELVRLICHELQTAWLSFKVSVSVGTRPTLAQLQNSYSANDNGMAFSFSVNMQSAGGDFQLLVPVASLGLFLGGGAPSSGESLRKGTMNAKLADKLLGTTFGLELALLGGKVPAIDLLNLSVGKIIPLGVSVRTPAVLKIEGHESFQAVPVRSGQHRAAQLLDRLQQSQSEAEATL